MSKELTYRRWRMVNPQSVFGYQYLFIGVDTPYIISYSEENHLSIDFYGFRDVDLKQMLEDYERDESYVKISLKKLLKLTQEEVGFISKTTLSFLYHIKEEELVIVTGVNESYQENSLELAYYPQIKKELKKIKKIIEDGLG